jgi:hypothetical protein
MGTRGYYEFCVFNWVMLCIRCSESTYRTCLSCHDRLDGHRAHSCKSGLFSAFSRVNENSRREISGMLSSACILERVGAGRLSQDDTRALAASHRPYKPIIDKNIPVTILPYSGLAC